MVDREKIPAVPELLDLAGETALVTGASGNIGAAIATRLGEAGASLVLHYHRNEAAATRLARSISAADIVKADLCDELSVSRLFTRFSPTLVVNNAATQPVTAMQHMALSEWRAVMGTNLDSVFLVTQYAAQAWMKAGDAGAIVNIGSIEGLDPAAGHSHYATSKAGLVMLTRAAALEFGAANIRVNCVSPGLIDRDGLVGDWPEGIRRWQDRAPLGRVGSAIDVADAVLFLLSPAARWISGANLCVDGGMSAQSKW